MGPGLPVGIALGAPVAWGGGDARCIAVYRRLGGRDSRRAGGRVRGGQVRRDRDRTGIGTGRGRSRRIRGPRRGRRVGGFAMATVGGFAIATGGCAAGGATVAVAVAV